MCEYCGCQALEAIDELTQEHERVVTLISHVRDAHGGGNVARMAEVAREIAALLGPHTQVEEHGLFPALAADFPSRWPNSKTSTGASTPCWRRRTDRSWPIPPGRGG
ncbi:hemerythrin domain-containing protein [Streptomyces sp. NPDC056159]|uniref:hemerythrin domain-containing protein n=1 Tax=unclassified Streptomyces TaxID=2593676 RepID=UPI00342C04B7